MQIAIVVESSDNVSVASEVILSTARRSQIAVVAVILSNLMVKMNEFKQLSHILENTYEITLMLHCLLAMAAPIPV